MSSYSDSEESNASSVSSHGHQKKSTKKSQLIERNKELTEKWIAFRKENLAIPLRGIEQLTCGKSATPVGIKVGTISRFTLPNVKIPKGSVASAQIHVSLFNKATRRFFGNTWISEEVGPIKSHSKQSLKLGQNVYMFTRIKDSNCVAIVETVLVVRQGSYPSNRSTSTTSSSGSTCNQYSCGWAMISMDLIGKSSKGSKVCSLYGGSPRALMMIGEKNHPETIGEGCSITLSIAPANQLKGIQGLVRENELFSETSVVAGLQPVRIAAPKGNSRNSTGVKLVPCISAGRKGSSKFNTRILPAMVATLSNLTVLVHCSLENALCQYLERYRGCSVMDNGQFVMKVGAHNGRTALNATPNDRHRSSRHHRHDESGESADSPSWVSVKLKRGVSVARHGEEFDEFKARKTVLVPGMVQDSRVALACELQYTVAVKESNQNKKNGLFTRTRADNNSIIRQNNQDPLEEVTVVVGCGVWIPHNGKVLLLRNQPARKSKRPIELELVSEEQPPFTSNASYAYTARSIPSCLIGFKLSLDESSSMFSKNRKGKDSDEENDSELSDSDLSSGKENNSSRRKQKKKRNNDDSSSSELSNSEADESDSEDDNDSDFEESSDDPDSDSSMDQVSKRGKGKRHKKQLEDDSDDSEESDSHRIDDNENLSESDGDESDSRQRKQKSTKSKPKSKTKTVVEFTPASARNRMEGNAFPSSIGPLAGSLLAATLQLPVQGTGSSASGFQTSSNQEGNMIIDDHMNLSSTRITSSNLSSFPPQSQTFGTSSAVLPNPTLPRSARTLLSQHGFTDVMGVAQGSRSDPFLAPAPSIELEVNDVYNAHEITFQFAAYRFCEGDNAVKPRNVHFTFQFYNALPTRTESMSLLSNTTRERRDQPIRYEDGLSRPHILVRANQPNKERAVPSMALKYLIDTSKYGPNEARNFAEYMSYQPMRVTVWDSDSLLPIGEVLLNLQPLLRQGDPEKKFAGEFDIVQEDAGGGVIDVIQGPILRGKLVGKLQLIATNFGLKGNGPKNQTPSVPTSTHRASLLALRDKDSQQQQRQQVPRVRHRVRPLADTNPDLANLLQSATLDDRKSRKLRKRNAKREAENARRANEAIVADSYSLSPQEVELLRSRFDRYDSNEISYKKFLHFAGMDRMSREKEYDNQVLHKLLTRVGGKVEAMERRTQNTNVLWGSFRDYDPMVTGRIPWTKCLKALQMLHIPCLTPEEERALRRALTHKAKEADEEALCDNESDPETSNKPTQESTHAVDKRMVDWVRLVRMVRAAMVGGDGLDIRDLIGRLQMVLVKAEKQGTKPEAAFEHFDANKDGVISRSELQSGLESIGFRIHSDNELDMLIKDFSEDGNYSTVTYHEFLHFIRRPQQGEDGDSKILNADDNDETPNEKLLTTPTEQLTKIEKQLCDILKAGEEQGIGIKESFELFDRDGNGCVTLDEFKSALESLGFKDLDEDELKIVMNKYDQNKNGKLSYDEFVKLVECSNETTPATVSSKRESTKSLGYRLLASIAQLVSNARRQGVEVVDVFEHFDEDKNGRVSRKELELGLIDLGFKINTTDPGQLDIAFQRIDHNNDGDVSVEEFLSFVGSYEAERQKKFERDVVKIVSKAIKQGIEISSCFKHFDKNNDGSISETEFREALIEIGFQSTNTLPGDVSVLLEKYDLNNSGSIDYNEFVKFISNQQEDSDNNLTQNSSSNQQETNDNNSTLEEKGDSEGDISQEHQSRSILEEALADAGPSKHDIERAVEKQGSSKRKISTRGIRRALKKLYVNRSMITKCTLEIKERIASSRNNERYEDEENEIHDIDNVIDVLVSSNTWDINSDAQQSDASNFEYDKETVRALRAKLFKVLKQAYFRGLDVERIFSRMDSANSGVISAQDFEEGLMQTGFSLYPVSSHYSSEDDDGEGSQPPRLQNTQAKLEQLELCRKSREVAPKRNSIRHRTAMGRDRLDPDGEFEDKACALDLVRQYREGWKKQLVGNLLRQAVTTKYTISPTFGKAEFFEFQFCNPYSHEERFSVEFKDPELRVIQDAAEWRHYRSTVEPSCGVTYGGVEQGLLSDDLQVTLNAGERISIPFVFLSFASGFVNENERENVPVVGLNSNYPIRQRTMSVTCNSQAHQHTVALMQVIVKPRQFIVNRTFHFWNASSDYFKRCLRVFPSTRTKKAISQQVRGDMMITKQGEPSPLTETMYIHCPDSNVVVEWKQTETRAAAGHITIQEVFLKYRCGEFPSSGSFYILLYSDPYHCLLEQVWHISIQTMLKVDIHAVLGQSVPKDLVVRGDRFARRVKCYSSEPAEVEFLPSSSLHLVAGAYNKVKLRYRPLTLTRPRPMAIHMVDCDSKELVCGWVVSTATSAPVVSKTFDITVPAETGAHKKIAYMNPWNHSRTFLLRTSDPTIVKVKEPRLDIKGMGKDYIRLWFNNVARHKPGYSCDTKEVLIFINDESDQNEECLMVRVTYN